MNIDDFVRGDNLIFWLCARIEELEEEINRVGSNL